MPCLNTRDVELGLRLSEPKISKIDATGRPFSTLIEVWVLWSPDGIELVFLFSIFCTANKRP